MNNYSQPRLALQPCLQSLFPSLRHGASDGFAGLQTDDSYPSHTEYITQTACFCRCTKLPISPWKFFFSIRKMLKLYLLWTARATLLMSWSDCPQRTIMLEFYFILQPILTEKELISLPIRNIICKVSSI